jgi:peptidoglycan hydrolase CwlO-like protein
MESFIDLFQFFAISFTIGVVFSSVSELILKKLRHKQIVSKDDLFERIHKTRQNLDTAIIDIYALQQEINTRTNKVEELKKEALEAENIKKLSNDQIKAMESIINGIVVKQGKKSFWISFLTNLCFFVLGVISSFVIQYVR